ncbi:MAG: tRNA lysidine(34) synthetase TilS [Verrucomicrobia bacterium]|nr:tRNA lysidine(34) synthetase TilS [Verrucomicrobiota bacterium]
MDLEKNVQLYLTQVDKPVLLGFSGGEDSLALAHCLIRLNIPFHIAHFDHGWRQSSEKEAQQLKNWATERGIPFYSMRGIGPAGKEDEAREQRYTFFEKLFQEGVFEALVLAHHQDDQVETILKRVLEGAHLCKLRGIKQIHQRGQMPIWRPLLGVPKEAIRSYIKEHQLQPLDDYTNRDPKYLRARMRLELLPSLNEKFGKQISPALLRIGHYSSELEDYLVRQTEKIQPVAGPLGVFWDFSLCHPIEVRFILRKWDINQKLTDKILTALAFNRANYRINDKILIDRGLVFILITASTDYRVSYGPVISGPTQNWRNWWQGKISVNIPAGPVTFGPLSPRLRKLQHNQRVPAFLRDSLPALIEDGKPIREFLSGKNYFFSVGQSVTFEINVNL